MKINTGLYKHIPINILLEMGKTNIKYMEKQYKSLDEASKERIVDVFLGKIKTFASFMPDFTKITGKATVSIVSDAALPILTHDYKDIPYLSVQIYHDGSFALKLSEELKRGDCRTDPSFCGSTIFSSKWVDWDDEYNVISKDTKPYGRCIYFSEYVIPAIISYGPFIEEEIEQKMKDILYNKLESVRIATDNCQRVANLQVEKETENGLEIEV